MGGERLSIDRHQAARESLEKDGDSQKGIKHRKFIEKYTISGRSCYNS